MMFYRQQFLIVEIRTLSGSTNYNPGRDTRDAEEINDVLQILSEDVNRYVLYFLRDRDKEASIEEVATYLVQQELLSQEQTNATFKREILPPLTEIELIEYDQDSGIVIYKSEPFLSDFISWIEAWERNNY